jgi:hypothetical protein
MTSRFLIETLETGHKSDVCANERKTPNSPFIGFCSNLELKNLVGGRPTQLFRKGFRMPKMTRRTFMRNGGLAASAAGLIPGGLPQAALAQDQAGSVFHVFAFQWKSQATEEEKARAKKDIAAFQGQIPGLLETHVGANISPRGKGYTFGGIMRFRDQAALDAYVQHPMHQALLVWLVPLIDAIELDLNS